MHGGKLIRRILWLLVLVLAIVLADQAIKRMMVNWIGPDATQHRQEILGSIFAFEYLENRGAAFGLFQQGTSILIVVSIIILLVAIGAMLWAAMTNMWLATSIALIVGGAIGNAIDRISRGYVVDYIAVGTFWKFNLADAAVTVGAVLTFIMLWRAEPAMANTQDHDS